MTTSRRQITSARRQESYTSSTFAHRKLSLSIALLCSVGLSATARAQTAPGNTAAPDTTEIVITGSRIRGVAPVGSPVISLGRDEIEASGVATTADLLRTIPAALTIGSDESNLRNTAQTGGLNVGFGTGINLRGLGSSSTLTLFNGRRVAPSGQRGSLFEISSIPPAALSRTEVVADGASAVYGSDAVGGVVNLVLRKNFEGAEASARYASASNNAQKQINLVVGKAWNSGSAIVAYDHFERGALLASDRPNLFNDDQRAYTGGADNRSNNSAAGNVVVGANFFPILHVGGVNSLGASVTAASANKQSNYLGFTVLPKQTRESVVVAVNQQITDGIEFFAEGFKTKRAFRQQNAAQSYASTVPSTNPFFLRPAGSTATSVTVNYSFINDLGPTVQTGGQQGDSYVGGFNINLGHDWKSEVFASISHSQDDRYSIGVNTCAISDPGPTAAAHRAICGNTTGVLFDTNPTTSLNVFGGGGNNNPATLAKILGWGLFHSDYNLKGYGVKADGPLFDLPAGKVRLATGAEYYIHNQQNRTPNTTAGADNTTVINPIIQHQYRTVQAFFVEAFIPIVGEANAMPGIQRLELSLAGRSEKYSDFGSTRNPKISFNWTPLKGINLHGTYGKSFRAPTLGDANPDSTVGINIASFREINGSQTQGMSIVGGNPALKPETAKTWSFGVDYRPDWFKGFDVSANYFKVDYTNRIGTPASALNNSFVQEDLYTAFITRRPANAATILTSGACAGQTFNACIQAQMNRPFYNNTITDPNQIQFLVDNRGTNAGILNTSGYDLQAHYVWGNALGEWNTGALLTYIDSFKTAIIPGGDKTEVVNTVDNPLRFRARVDLGWRQGSYRANLFANYNNSYNNLTVAPKQSVSAYTTIDMTLGYSTGDKQSWAWLNNVNVSLNVQNLFDKDPPFALVGNQLFDSLTGSATGRTTALQITKKW